MIHINFTLSYIQAYLIGASLVTFILYAYDKLQAIKSLKNPSRVSENKLLFTTLMGGTIGSILSMLIFRHKIKKPSFMIKFSIVVIAQMATIFLFLKIQPI